MDPQVKAKSQALQTLMSSPKAADSIFRTFSSPVGSTHAQRARKALGMTLAAVNNKIGTSQDGQGGPGPLAPGPLLTPPADAIQQDDNTSAGPKASLSSLDSLLKQNAQLSAAPPSYQQSATSTPSAKKTLVWTPNGFQAQWNNPPSLVNPQTVGAAGQGLQWAGDRALQAAGNTWDDPYAAPIDRPVQALLAGTQALEGSVIRGTGIAATLGAKAASGLQGLGHSAMDLLGGAANYLFTPHNQAPTGQTPAATPSPVPAAPATGTPAAGQAAVDGPPNPNAPAPSAVPDYLKPQTLGSVQWDPNASLTADAKSKWHHLRITY